MKEISKTDENASNKYLDVEVFRHVSMLENTK